MESGRGRLSCTLLAIARASGIFSEFMLEYNSELYPHFCTARHSSDWSSVQDKVTLVRRLPSLPSVREDFWAKAVQIRVFPSYMLTSFAFSLLI